VIAVSWTNHQQVLPESGPWSHLDSLRAFRPSVVQEPDGTLRMWYSGHDGTTGRILEAVQAPGQPWERLGVCLDAGATGSTDAYGVEAPSVVRLPEGFLMAYSGSDGADSRLHMAASPDGHEWEPQGTFLPRGEADAVGATHPCLVITGEQWWLFYSGFDGADEGRRAEIMAAVSTDGRSWSRVGSVLRPGPGELALSEPSVLVRQRRFTMVFVCDDGIRASIDTATSRDGVSWDRRGSTLRLGRQSNRPNRIRSPNAAHLDDGSLHLWYSTRSGEDPPGSCRMWTAAFDSAAPGPASGARPGGPGT
jgi:predicted GH43/DUF377 family glycosyl hydrolase